MKYVPIWSMSPFFLFFIIPVSSSFWVHSTWNWAPKLLMCKFLMYNYQLSEYLVMALEWPSISYIGMVCQLTLMSLGSLWVVSHGRTICLSIYYNCIGLDGKRWENIMLLITVSRVSQSVKSWCSQLGLNGYRSLVLQGWKAAFAW